MPSFRSISSFTRQSATHLTASSATALLLALCCHAHLHAKTTEQDLIRQSLQTGQLAQGQKLLKAELQRLPKDVNLRLLEGVFQAQNGQKDKAIETFKKLAADHPNLPEPHNNLGVLYAERNQLDLAKAEFEKALQTLPSYTASHKNLMDLNARLAKQAYARAFRFDEPSKANAAGASGLIMLSAVGQGTLADTPAPPAPAAPVVVADAKPAAAPTPAPSAAPAVPAPVAPAPVPVAPVAPKVAAKVEPALPAAPPPPPPKPAVPAPTPAKPVPAPAVTPAAPAVPAAPKVAPSAPVPPPATPASTATADAAAIEKSVKAWASAWSKRDVSQYLDAYAPSFEPANRQARVSWAKDRRIRIEQRKFIRVTVSRLQISVKGAQAQVKLDQQYESDGLNTSTRKTLDLVNIGGRWLILREKAS